MTSAVDSIFKQPDVQTRVIASVLCPASARRACPVRAKQKSAPAHSRSKNGVASLAYGRAKSFPELIRRRASRSSWLLIP
jgi:hypothetical protein